MREVPNNDRRLYICDSVELKCLRSNKITNIIPTIFWNVFSLLKIVYFNYSFWSYWKVANCGSGDRSAPKRQKAPCFDFDEDLINAAQKVVILTASDDVIVKMHYRPTVTWLPTSWLGLTGLKSYISLSDWSCYPNILQGLGATRFGVEWIPWLWNVTDVSAAVLFTHRCNAEILDIVKHQSRSLETRQDFVVGYLILYWNWPRVLTCWN